MNGNFFCVAKAGQYSAFFVYLRLVMGFTEKETALFIGVVGLLSVVAQTAGLTVLMKTVGNKNTIIIGLGKREKNESTRFCCSLFTVIYKCSFKAY